MSSSSEKPQVPRIEVMTFPVGNGDTSVARFIDSHREEQYLLVDCHSAAAKSEQYKFLINHIAENKKPTLCLITHYDSDHMFGFPEIFEKGWYWPFCAPVSVKTFRSLKAPLPNPNYHIVSENVGCDLLEICPARPASNPNKDDPSSNKDDPSSNKDDSSPNKDDPSSNKDDPSPNKDDPSPNKDDPSPNKDGSGDSSTQLSTFPKAIILSALSSKDAKILGQSNANKSSIALLFAISKADSATTNPIGMASLADLPKNPVIALASTVSKQSSNLPVKDPASTDSKQPSNLPLGYLSQYKLAGIKASHHGSDHNNPAELYKLPMSFVIITADGSHRYHHPHPETLERIRSSEHIKMLFLTNYNNYHQLSSPFEKDFALPPDQFLSSDQFDSEAGQSVSSDQLDDPEAGKSVLRNQLNDPKAVSTTRLPKSPLPTYIPVPGSYIKTTILSTEYRLDFMAEIVSLVGVDANDKRGIFDPGPVSFVSCVGGSIKPMDPPVELKHQHRPFQSIPIVSMPSSSTSTNSANVPSRILKAIYRRLCCLLPSSVPDSLPPGKPPSSHQIAEPLSSHQVEMLDVASQTDDIPIAPVEGYDDHSPTFDAFKLYHHTYQGKAEFSLANILVYYRFIPSTYMFVFSTRHLPPLAPLLRDDIQPALPFVPISSIIALFFPQYNDALSVLQYIMPDFINTAIPGGHLFGIQQCTPGSDIFGKYSITCTRITVDIPLGRITLIDDLIVLQNSRLVIGRYSTDDMESTGCVISSQLALGHDQSILINVSLMPAFDLNNMTRLHIRFTKIYSLVDILSHFIIGYGHSEYNNLVSFVNTDFTDPSQVESHDSHNEDEKIIRQMIQSRPFFDVIPYTFTYSIIFQPLLTSVSVGAIVFLARLPFFIHYSYQPRSSQHTFHGSLMPRTYGLDKYIDDHYPSDPAHPLKNIQEQHKIHHILTTLGVTLPSDNENSEWIDKLLNLTIEELAMEISIDKLSNSTSLSTKISSTDLHFNIGGVSLSLDHIEFSLTKTTTSSLPSDHDNDDKQTSRDGENHNNAYTSTDVSFICSSSINNINTDLSVLYSSHTNRPTIFQVEINLDNTLNSASVASVNPLDTGPIATKMSFLKPSGFRSAYIAFSLPQPSISCNIKFDRINISDTMVLTDACLSFSLGHTTSISASAHLDFAFSSDIDPLQEHQSLEVKGILEPGTVVLYALWTGSISNCLGINGFTMTQGGIGISLSTSSSAISVLAGMNIVLDGFDNINTNIVLSINPFDPSQFICAINLNAITLNQILYMFTREKVDLLNNFGIESLLCDPNFPRGTTIDSLHSLHQAIQQSKLIPGQNIRYLSHFKDDVFVQDSKVNVNYFNYDWVPNDMFIIIDDSTFMSYSLDYKKSSSSPDLSHKLYQYAYAQISTYMQPKKVFNATIDPGINVGGVLRVLGQKITARAKITRQGLYLNANISHPMSLGNNLVSLSGTGDKSLQGPSILIDTIQKRFAINADLRLLGAQCTIDAIIDKTRVDAQGTISLPAIGSLTVIAKFPFTWQGNKEIKFLFIAGSLQSMIGQIGISLKSFVDSAQKQVGKIQSAQDSISRLQRDLDCLDRRADQANRDWEDAKRISKWNPYRYAKIAFYSSQFGALKASRLIAVQALAVAKGALSVVATGASLVCNGVKLTIDAACWIAEKAVKLAGNIFTLHKAWFELMMTDRDISIKVGADFVFLGRALSLGNTPLTIPTSGIQHMITNIPSTVISLIKDRSVSSSNDNKLKAFAPLSLFSDHDIDMTDEGSIDQDSIYISQMQLTSLNELSHLSQSNMIDMLPLPSQQLIHTMIHTTSNNMDSFVRSLDAASYLINEFGFSSSSDLYSSPSLDATISGPFSLTPNTSDTHDILLTDDNTKSLIAHTKILNIQFTRLQRNYESIQRAIIQDTSLPSLFADQDNLDGGTLLADNIDEIYSPFKLGSQVTTFVAYEPRELLRSDQIDSLFVVDHDSITDDDRHTIYQYISPDAASSLRARFESPLLPSDHTSPSAHSPVPTSSPLTPYSDDDSTMIAFLRCIAHCNTPILLYILYTTAYQYYFSFLIQYNIVLRDHHRQRFIFFTQRINQLMDEIASLSLLTADDMQIEQHNRPSIIKIYTIINSIVSDCAQSNRSLTPSDFHLVV